MADHPESTRPGLGIPGPAGAELTAGQHATGSGVTSSGLTSQQHAIGPHQICMVCHKRLDRCKGKVRNINESISRHYKLQIDIDNPKICQICYKKYIDNRTVIETPISSQEVHLINAKALSGFNEQQIDDLANQYLSNMKCTEIRSKELALLIYLTKLKKGQTNTQLATQFNIEKANINKCVKAVRESLFNNLVERKFGLKHTTRDVLVSHTSDFVKTLHCTTPGSVAVMADGTYIYIEKSSNNEFQRKTFSVQKGRHLIKPMVLICSDGYIIDIMGVHEATKNDATIIKERLEHHKTKNAFKRIFRHGDVILVDRGFRDAIDSLENVGFVVKMPTCSTSTVLTTQEANETRLVTACRWKIECVNGKLKSFKLLDGVRPNSTIKTLKHDCKIAAALLNEYFTPIENNTETSIEIANKMLDRLNRTNNLVHKVDQLNLDRKSKIFTKLSGEDFPDFPRLTMADLIDITLGSYQLKMAKSYITEHLNNKTVFEVCIDEEEPHLIRLKVQSRHVSRKAYNVYIEYQSRGLGPSAIRGYMCRCKSGLRTVGTCSHVTAVLWFLGLARYQGPIKPVGEHHMEIFVPSDIEESDNE